MLTKKCPNCGETKTEEHFYHRSGKKSHLLRSYCKECENKHQYEKYWDNPEQSREYSRKINAKHKDKMREYNKKHYLEIKDKEWRKEQTRRIHRKYRKLNPEKFECRMITNSAIVSGKIERQPCIICGNKKSEAHHENYSEPFDIIWLCKTCHTKLHNDKYKIPVPLTMETFFKRFN